VPQVLLVEGERFVREQMGGDRVAAEGIEMNHVVIQRSILLQLALHAQPAVAHDDFDLGVAGRRNLLEVGEVFGGDLEDLGIDVVETIDIARLGMRGHRAATESNHGDAQALAGPRVFLDRQRGARACHIVRRGLQFPLGRGELKAVPDAAVVQRPSGVIRIVFLVAHLRDRHRAVEISFDGNQVAVRLR
jgi:hypothetical protein